jgi:hypothetical protein
MGGPPLLLDFLSTIGADRSFVTVDLSFLPFVMSVISAPYIRLLSAGARII